MGVDFGLKRVGYAVCDSLRILATPLRTYRTSSMRDTIDYTARLCVEQDVGGVVVGLPLNLDGTESVQSDRAAHVDSMAANVILQSYIEHNKQ